MALDGNHIHKRQAQSTLPEHCHDGHRHEHAHKHGHCNGHNTNHDHNHGGHEHGHHDHGPSCNHDHGSGVWGYLPHSHGLSERISADARSLKMACVILTISLCVQVGGGLVVDSSVLEAEAVHTALDGLVLVVSLLSIALASRRRNPRYSYGYGRAEVLSALVSILTLALMCVQLAGGAMRRLLKMRATSAYAASRKGEAVLIAEALTLLNNILIALVLARNSSLNVRALRAHVVGDSIGNVVVLVAGGVMWAKPQAAILDPILTLVIVFIICALNIPLARETVDALMQAAPPGFETNVLKQRIKDIRGVKRVRDAHAWTLTSGAVVGTVKLEVEPEITEAVEFDRVQKEAEEALVRSGVNEVTVQVRSHRPCDDGSDEDDDIATGPRGRIHRVENDARYELVDSEEVV